MKKITSYKLSLAFIFLCGILIFSCRKSDDPIFIPPSGNLLFVSLSGIDYIKQTVNLTSYITPAGVQSSDSFKLRAISTVPSATDIIANVSIDTTLVSNYNTLNGTSYAAMPAAGVSFKSTQMVIKAGTMESDSMIVTLTDGSVFNKADSLLLPITLTSLEKVKDTVPPITANNTVYVLFTPNRLRVQLGNSQPDENHIIEMSYATVVGTNIAGSPVNANAYLLPQSTNQALSLSLQAQANSSLVQAYNTKHNTAYLTLPANTYTLSTGKLTIDAGKTSSTDRVTITLQNVNQLSNADSGNTIYLLPVITKEDNNKTFPDTAYVRVTQKLVNIDPSNGTVTGTAIDRTVWAATASSNDPYFSTSDPKYVFDGDYNTGWLSDIYGSYPQDLTVDMGKTNTIKGFDFTANYALYTAYGIVISPIEMTVYTSMDGVTWKSQGVYSNAPAGGTADAPDVKYVKFYSPVQARYFRFSITGSSYPSAPLVGFSEINAIE